MIEALSPILVGELADMQDTLFLAGEREADLPGGALLQQEVLKELLTRFGRKYPDPDIKAVASLWSKWHFFVLVAPAVIVDVLADHKLPTDIQEVGIILSPEGRTTAVTFPHAGRKADPVDAFERFGPLIERHLDPLVHTLSAVSGAAPRVFWSNLGNLLENLLRQAEAELGGAAPGMAHAKTLLTSRDWPGRRSNPLFEPVRYIADQNGAQRRWRRVCCIRYLIEGLGYCTTCPLIRPARTSHPVICQPRHQ